MARIICTVTNDLNYDQRMIRICGSLAKAGHEVILVGRQLPGSKALSDYAFRQKRLACWFHSGKLFYLEYNLRLFFFLLTQKADVNNAIDLDTILPNLLVARLRGNRLIYDAHEYFTETPEVVRRPAIQKIWAWVARVAVPRVDAAYTVGSALAEIMSQRYGVPFQTIRNLPLEKSTAKAVDRNEPPVILYQGALNEGRGLETAIRAMHQIDKAVLWLAGEGDLSQQLRQLVENEALEDRVVFLGFLKPDDLAELTPKATIGLNLLENKGLSYYYSLANKAFDYLQAEVPAIHMAFPEYTALAQQYGGMILLPELDPATLAQAINDLLRTPQSIQNLRRECRTAASQLTWKIEEERLLAIYA